MQNIFGWNPLPVVTLILIKSNSLLPAQIRIFNGVPPPSHLRTLTKNSAFFKCALNNNIVLIVGDIDSPSKYAKKS